MKPSSIATTSEDARRIAANIVEAAGAAPQRLNRPSPVSYEQVITIVRNRRNLCTRGGD